MKYQIDTIPIWEALEYDGQCMLCTLQAKTEAGEVERVLGASVMEPDVRIRTNERGFCCKHQQMMFAHQNRLSHALLMDTHTMEALQNLEKIINQVKRMRESADRAFPARASRNTIANMLRELTANCVVCESINTHMERYTYTMLHLWKTNPKFKQQFGEVKGFCIPHAADLIEASSKQLNVQQRQDLCELCLNLLFQYLAEDEKALMWFTQKFDYRNQDKPWGESKNAIERTVNRLRGYCIGQVPYAMPKK